MNKLALNIVACVVGSSFVFCVNSEARSQYVADEIVVRGSCTGVGCGLGLRFQIYGVDGGGGGGTSCDGLGLPFPQLLWEPPEPGTTHSCELQTTQLPPGLPPTPSSGEVAVSLANAYEFDTNGDGNIDYFVSAPVVIVGADPNLNGIPDIWEGFMINGIARQAP